MYFTVSSTFVINDRRRTNSHTNHTERNRSFQQIHLWLVILLQTKKFCFQWKKCFFIPFHCSISIRIHTKFARARGAFNAPFSESSSEGRLQGRLRWLEKTEKAASPSAASHSKGSPWVAPLEGLMLKSELQGVSPFLFGPAGVCSWCWMDTLCPFLYNEPFDDSGLLFSTA